MDNQDLSQYKALFIKTAQQYLTSLQDAVATLQHASKDDAALEVAHRSAHSMKSQCSFMQYHETAELCHMLEIYFRDLREGKKQLLPDHIPILLRSTHVLHESLTSISEQGTESLSGQEVREIALALGVNQ